MVGQAGRSRCSCSSVRCRMGSEGPPASHTMVRPEASLVCQCQRQPSRQDLHGRTRSLMSCRISVIGSVRAQPLAWTSPARLREEIWTAAAVATAKEEGMWMLLSMPAWREGDAEGFVDCNIVGGVAFLAVARGRRATCTKSRQQVPHAGSNPSVSCDLDGSGAAYLM